MDDRMVRSLAKSLGVNAQQRQEICRILREDDFSCPFPLTGSITFAIAILLIDIIEECRLSMRTALPIALRCVDPNLTIDPAPGSIKRACERRNKSGKDLHARMDSLYSNFNDKLGPFCTKLGIDKSWLHDAHQYDVPSSSPDCINNGVILELYQYWKSNPNLTWHHAQQWLKRLFPESETIPTQTLSTDWKRLQHKKNLRQTKASREHFLEEQYKIPIVKKSQRSDTVHDEFSSGSDATPASPSALTSDKILVDSTAACSSQAVDIYHMVYDSPTKKKLVEHICEQDKQIAEQDMKITELQRQLDSCEQTLLSLRTKYDTLFTNRENLKEDLAQLQASEDELIVRIKEISKQYNIYNVNKKLKYREDNIEKYKKFAEEYKMTLAKERAEMKEILEKYKTEKWKKRKEQRRVFYYKSKASPLEQMNDGQIRHLLKESKNLQLQVDDLQCQLEQCMSDKAVSTFENGKYVDAVRLVCYDFLARNVGTHHVSALIRSVLENLAGVQIDKLPKTSLVKVMALEAEILAKKELARTLLKSPNSTLHMDATTKKQRHFFSIQVSTNDRSFSGGLIETVAGDTEAQVDTTKDFFMELSQLLPDEDQDNAQFKLLFNIKNSMSDRGPTSRGWVEGLELWRDKALKDHVLPNYGLLNAEQRSSLSKINDFYCGKHFILGLAERTKVGLSMWEEEVGDILGLVGMEALREFVHWNCEKPAGLRLVRTASELVGAGAKMPHGIPETFKSFLPEGERNNIPVFEHNRFNVVFTASSAVYHHRHTILKLLEELNSDNKLHKAVIADIKSASACAEVQSMAMLEKHITTPLNTVTSKKEHILNLRSYYSRLKDFLTEIIEDPSPILNGTAVMFDDCPPVKDSLWDSIYDVDVSPEQEAATEQIIPVLCASLLVVCERQLFDFFHGKWAANPSADLINETMSVPRNNDISERDFSGLDRLMRTKMSANVSFMSGLLLYTHNKTSQSLREMSDSALQKEIGSAVKLAREKAKAAKQKKTEIRQQRYNMVQDRKKRQAEKEMKNMRDKQKAQDDIQIDGQCKNVTDLHNLKQKYSGKDLTAAIKRQFSFYKTLNIPNLVASKFFMSSHSKPLPEETLLENLEHMIEKWKIAMSQPEEQATCTIESSGERLQTGKNRIIHLKRKLVEEAQTERNKKEAVEAKKKKLSFPGETLIGMRIKHKFVVNTNSGKTKHEWFKATVLRKASKDDILKYASEEDVMNYEHQGFCLYVVDYDKEDELEAIALQSDWENGDIILLSE